MDLTFAEIKKKFSGCGLKTTAQRTAIYQALLHSTAHPTAEDLFAEVAPQFPDVVVEHGLLHSWGPAYLGPDS